MQSWIRFAVVWVVCVGLAALLGAPADGVDDDDGGDSTKTPTGPLDARILALRTNAAGENFRDWRSVVVACERVDISSWAINGSRLTS